MKKTAAQETMEKIGSLFDEFVQDVFGISPLDEGFENWKKTTEKIKKRREQNDEQKSKQCLYNQ